jgi:glucosamine--fructose-6-phosphate aminotransferase (isomerizing)
MSSHHTYNEILSQPDAWSAALEVLRSQTAALREFYHAGEFEAVLFTACGSPYYLGLAAAAQMNQFAGPVARALPASESWLTPRLAYRPGQKTLLITLSRSGETSETIRACQTFRANGHGAVLTLTCNPGASLTQAGHLNLVFPSGQEESLAQTRAFTTLFLATTYLAALWASQENLLNELTRLPALCQSLISNHQSLTHALGHNPTLDRFYFLGSGVRYGLACELSLKMKEMSLSHSEPFHVLEFRHGPKSMATAGSLVIGLIDEANQAQEMAVLNEVAGLGAQVLSISERDTDVAFNSDLSEAARQVLYLPIGQLLAFERAIAKGLNPDQPANLDAFVVLK